MVGRLIRFSSGDLLALLLALPGFAAPAAGLLGGLKWPAGIKLAPLFTANALGQASLNLNVRYEGV